MNEETLNEVFLKRFKKHSILTGILFIILGIAGMLLPVISSLTVTIFIGWFLVFGGRFFIYHLIKSPFKKWIDWIKPLLLIISGALLIIFPFPGVAAVGLLLAFYLLMDAGTNFLFAFETYPSKGWGWVTFNGIISLILATMLFLWWPFDSYWFVGLFVGISLFVDGIVLLIAGINAHKTHTN